MGAGRGKAGSFDTRWLIRLSFRREPRPKGLLLGVSGRWPKGHLFRRIASQF